MSLFTGLSAFPLTPLVDDQIDEPAFITLMRRLVAAQVDSITVLGSTGAYAYLTPEERARVTQLAVSHADGIPVFVGVSALRTSQVLDLVASAEQAGAAGLLLAPMSYQPLTEDDVFELFRTVSLHTQLPVVVYDNPGTTRFDFTIDLYQRIANLAGVASIKIPGVPNDPAEAGLHVERIRSVIPNNITIGVSGDAFAATGLSAGCDVWYSVIGGTLPEAALEIVRAVQKGRFGDAASASQRLAPLWQLFAEFGSFRVIAAAAEHLGLAQRSSIPLPLLGLGDEERERLAAILADLQLH